MHWRIVGQPFPGGRGAILGQLRIDRMVRAVPLAFVSASTEDKTIPRILRPVVRERGTGWWTVKR